MAKTIRFLKKGEGPSIQGVAGPRVVYLWPGQAVSTNVITGGGFIDSITLEGSVVVIRKRTAEGKRYRNFGKQVCGAETITLVGDGVIIPATQVQSMVFADEESSQKNRA